MKIAFKYYMSIYFQKKFVIFTILFSQFLSSILSYFVPLIFVGNVLTKAINHPKNIDLNSLMLPIVLSVVALILGEILRTYSHLMNGVVVSKNMEEISLFIFEKTLNKDSDFFSNNFGGSIVSKFSKLVKNFEVFNDLLLFQITIICAEWISIAIILFIKLPLVGLLFVLIGFLMYFSVFKIIKNRLKLVAIRSQLISDESAVVADAVTNILAIKAQAEEQYEIEKLKVVTNKIQKLRLKTWWIQDFNVTNILNAYKIITFTFSIFLSIYASKYWNADPLNIFFVFNFVSIFAPMIIKATFIWRDIESALSEAGEMLYLLSEPDSVQDVKVPQEISKKINGHIKISNIDFRYPQSNQNLFTNFDLEINQTQKVGLVGPSGSGKSTIIKLLLRFIDPQNGSIFFDDYDISKITQKSLRQHISYVPQDCMLFHRSLFDNIRYGNLNATDKQVLEAAKKASIDEFVGGLPDGFDTLVGERGVKLSGGQRQRVAIARAMLRDSPILILDEATSALDSESEVLIQDSLVKLMEDKTVIAIAHRLSTISHLDRIVVLENGCIVQDGSHSSLTNEDGLYKRLWDHQSGGYIGEI